MGERRRGAGRGCCDGEGGFKVFQWGVRIHIRMATARITSVHNSLSTSQRLQIPGRRPFFVSRCVYKKNWWPLSTVGSMGMGGTKGWTSDLGWGCILRTSQSLLATALGRVGERSSKHSRPRASDVAIDGTLYQTEVFAAYSESSAASVS
ncbi:hypothetical protein B0H13DRAFT_2038481 [Mycena leptocephala]|nr:hypothetical protein B0H13DRAFT_2038481 [Mycena leptocephala]